VALAQELIDIGGIPAHPLVVHAVVVLLPLAAISATLIALAPRWRRRYGWPVLVLTALAVATIPLAKTTGDQLRAALAGVQNPLIDEHQQLGDQMLPFGLAFGVAVLVLLVAGRLADRERAAEAAAPVHAAATTGAGSTADTSDAEPGNTAEAPPVSRTWRRIAVVAAALVVTTATASTVQVVRVGHSGSAAVWEGVGGS